ncbi:MAG: S8 family peptidase [Bacteroidia bacterium]|nr:S8 family peptidase [Bacteroidia bacterium]
MRKLTFIRTFLLLVITLSPAWAQEQTSIPAPKDWFLRDPEQDQLQGVSAEKVYQTLLAGQPSRTVIVAVVDSGVDIDHEDLKNIIWVNEDEISGNGIDDDKNGYIDDIHGWNFIGGTTNNVKEDTYELTREYVRLKKKFENVENGKVPKKQKAEYEQHLKNKDKFEKLKAKNEQQYGLYKNLQGNVILSVDTLKAILKTDTLTQQSLQDFNTTDPSLLFAKGFLLNLFKNIGPEGSIDDLLGQLKEAVDYFGVIVNYGYNENFDSRLIVGDNYANPYEKNYGNNDVKGPDPEHGTHVAGIIGADRKNDIGIKGIADNVRIMSVRTVPNGDERDKDVANAIFYAVDNGAKIINMSFGKSFSPEKIVVDKAVKYAEQKGVLLIHAAGNDSENIDEKKNFPSRYYADGKEAKNWLEIGASAWGSDQEFVGSFSNYGKKSVDFFAPGVEIYSTTPHNNYKNQSGTSMASPTVAGVAALLMSYFPELSYLEIKDILKKSTRKFDTLEVASPGGSGNVKFSELSNTGGLVNAYEAVKMAQLIKTQKGVK